MIDWGLRLVLLLAVPSAVALLTFAQPLVAVLYHYGAFKDSDVPQVAHALMGYGFGLIGLVAIKILAPALLRQARHQNPRKNCHGGADIYADFELLFAALFAACRTGAVDWPGCTAQRRVAAVGAACQHTFMARPGWGRFAMQCWRPAH